MIGIAAVSLVVGGIVIMNIMLVSVTERTRRSAFAKRWVRAVTNSPSVSGRIGPWRWSAERSAFCWRTFAKGITLASGCRQRSSSGRLAGVFVAASVGIFWGVSREGGRLDPIAALRFET